MKVSNAKIAKMKMHKKYDVEIQNCLLEQRRERDLVSHGLHYHNQQPTRVG